jgi:enolase
VIRFGKRVTMSVLAMKAALHPMCLHRSGDTIDSFIADLTVAILGI